MRARKPAASTWALGHAQWYKDVVIYELRVRSFFDSNGDGVGDFPGITAKLDYLHDLGVTALWLLPFYPSPLRDDGYDIADYTSVDPTCGTLDDFREFLDQAHRRGLRVITELVLNHTSDQHPWFQRARRAKPDSRWRNFYVWNDSPERYRDARIIFQDFETSNWTWDPVAQAYFWHRFYSHQPDLNFDNPEVREAMFGVLDFWLGMGVDGLRLDAVPYLFEREGTNCENLPETHTLLKALRAHVDENFPERMLLAEANQWPEDAVSYFGNGDECHMAFHFPIMPRMFMAIHMEDRFPILDILDQTPAIPETCQWALFLRNHDELTLEMVTDEERDYMRRMYAADPNARINLGIRRRLAPLLGNNRRRIELMNALLCALPGTPVLYYGDEIGMGDNFYLGDRNGVRTPMQWSGDRNAGFSHANPQRMYLPVIVDPEYHYQACNVETQQANPQSLLWWMKRLLALRRQVPAFGRGSITFLHPDNSKVLAFIRSFQGQHILVVANLSRFVQYVQLDLAQYVGRVPRELFGYHEFPLIGEQPYLLTLGPHGFYWFDLVPPAAPQVLRPSRAEVPVVEVRRKWQELLEPAELVRLEALLPEYLAGQRWFGGKGKRLKSVSVKEWVTVPLPAGSGLLLHVLALFQDADPELYQVPLVQEQGEAAQAILHAHPGQVLARVSLQEAQAQPLTVLCEGLMNEQFCRCLLDCVGRHRALHGQHGDAQGQATRIFRDLAAGLEPLAVSRGQLEQTNTSIVFGNRLILKLYRRLEAGINPDLELGRYLVERQHFAHCPPVAGYLTYRRAEGEYTLGILHQFVANQGDAWTYTQDELHRYLERVHARPESAEEIPVPEQTLTQLAAQEPTPLAKEVVGPYLEAARLLGQRTAQMHLALAQERELPDFKPEPFSALYQRSLYQAMRTQAGMVMRQVRANLQRLPAGVVDEARRLLQREGEILAHFAAMAKARVHASRMRIHGDYHLGQVLHTGNDFWIFDFEGEPARPLSERRIKRSPLRDVASMLRSLSYAASAALNRPIWQSTGQGRGELILPAWIAFWERWSMSVFLRAYLDEARESGILPREQEDLELMLDAYTLEKALYEVAYELNNRPDWLPIPLRGIHQLLDQRPAQGL